MLKLSVQSMLSGGWRSGKRDIVIGAGGLGVLGPIKSNTASPTARHCCNGSLEFDAVLPRR